MCLISVTENIVLRDFFPLRPHTNCFAVRLGDGQSSADADALVEAMTAARLRENSEGLRPGQAYRIYNTQDILGSLPEQYELIVGRVAKWAGVDEEYVCGIVEKFEKRLARWWDRVRRSERAGSASKGKTVGEGSDEEDVRSPLLWLCFRRFLHRIASAGLSPSVLDLAQGEICRLPAFSNSGSAYCLQSP